MMRMSQIAVLELQLDVVVMAVGRAVGGESREEKDETLKKTENPD